MTAKGKVALPKPSARQGWDASSCFFFVQILIIWASQRFLSIRLREISSFMISLVPP